MGARITPASAAGTVANTAARPLANDQHAATNLECRPSVLLAMDDAGRCALSYGQDRLVYLEQPPIAAIVKSA
jgi:hypothetical protein